MYFDRFDIVHAHYVFYVLNHSGMYSWMYERQCKIQQYYKPPLFGTDTLENENQIDIYNDLAEKHNCLLYSE